MLEAVILLELDKATSTSTGKQTNKLERDSLIQVTVNC